MTATEISLSDGPGDPANSGPSLPRAVLVKLAGVTKSFGPTRANSDISLAIARGGVLGLVGGNGAGKSTWMRILGGVARTGRGQLQFADKTLSFDFYNATDAQTIGIRIVHQELSLCDN